MIRLEEIKGNYPPKMQVFPLGILREYSQYKILESIFSSKYSKKLVFMGGTALRIVYNNQRFSEDLDFDNQGLTKTEFEDLTKLVKKSLELEGYEVEIRNVYKKAFHCYIKIPEILHKEGLSNLPNQKITIRIDTTPQNYEYTPEVYRFDSFGIFQEIYVVPKDVLLAQKCLAFLERKRTKARDLFDISYLLSLNISVEMNYIKEKLKIEKKEELRKVLLKHTGSLDLKALSKEIEPFLFNPSQINRVLDFRKTLQATF